jgi:hypothetical protein
VRLDESFASSPADLAVEALALAVMTGGIVALAHRAPQVAREEAEAGYPGHHAARPRRDRSGKAGNHFLTCDSNHGPFGI